MTKRERQAREYAAERIEDAQRLGRYLRRHWLPIMRRLNYAAMVCSGASPADAALPAADCLSVRSTVPNAVIEGPLDGRAR